MEANSDMLFNISTGKATSETVKTYLLTVPERGRETHKEFVATCMDDPNQFERPIKKEKIASFKENGKKMQVPKTNESQLSSVLEISWGDWSS